MKILAGIITFNPNINRLEQSIKSIASQVDMIVLYDNKSDNNQEIKKLCNRYLNIRVMNSPTNKGVATGLNAILRYGSNNGFKWLLTLDQDSVCPENMVEQYKKHMSVTNIAIICPQVIDRRQEYKYSFKEKQNVPSQQILRCITAGSLIDINICRKLGGFDDFLFIDFVDFDYCKRVIINKYKIIQVNSVILDQELGDVTYSKHYSLFLKLGKVLNSRLFMRLAIKRNFSPLRRFYVSRNHIYYLRKYKNYCDIRQELLMGFFALVKLIVFCPNKVKLFKATLRGIKSGMKIHVVPYEPINVATNKSIKDNYND